MPSGATESYLGACTEDVFAVMQLIISCKFKSCGDSVNTHINKQISREANEISLFPSILRIHSSLQSLKQCSKSNGFQIFCCLPAQRHGNISSPAKISEL